MESQSKKHSPEWEAFVAENTHDLGRYVGHEVNSHLLNDVCASQVDELMDWLTPMIGERNAYHLKSNVFDLFVQVSDLSIDAGIAVERTRTLAESDPRRGPDDGPDAERWYRLAVAEFVQESISAPSLIPPAE